MATSVAVSKARISILRFLLAAPRPPRRARPSAGLRRGARSGPRRAGGSAAEPGLRPLDEHDRVVEVRLEVAPLGRGQAAEAVEVEVGHVRVPRVAVADRERRARDRRGDAERAAGAADERRLPRPSSPDTVTTSPVRSRRASRAAASLGLARPSRRGRGERSDPTGLAALEQAELDRLGLDPGLGRGSSLGAGGSTTRSRSAGIRAKSSSRTFSIDGV